MKSSNDLVAIPADPTRSYAVALHWPGVGYWDWAARQWEPALGRGGLLPLRREGGTLLARPTYPPLRAPVLLELHALGADGLPACGEALDVETVYPS